MHDRFMPKHNRVRQSQAVADDLDERGLIAALGRSTQCQYYLGLLEECVHHPNWIECVNSWVPEALVELRAERWHNKWKLRIGNLYRAIKANENKVFIGPIQRKVKHPSPRTLKWRANLTSLEQTQAARPLKPPGRR